MITQIKLPCALVSALWFLCSINAATAQDWQELKGEHFIVYFIEDMNFARKTLNRAEDYYKQIADDLAYARHSNFWQWGNRVKIYIYPDGDSYRAFLEAHDLPRWSIGLANYRDKEIISFSHSEKFLDSILPHEMTHLIFRDYVGIKNIPIWIDEGVAQWEEKDRRQFAKRKIKKLLETHSPIPIERLNKLNVGAAKNTAIVELFYVEAVSLVNFLITEYGGERFIFFCRQLRDGKDMDEALKFAYPTFIRSTKELETKWLEYLQEKGK